jgi:AraC-like DNA-binding protein
VEIYESHKLEDPRLPLILHSFHYKKDEALGFSNWHENVELLCPTSGRATVSANGVRFTVEAGEIAVINANHIHDILANEELHFYCLIVDRAFCLSNHLALDRLQFRPLIRDPELFALVTEAAAEYEERERPFRPSLLRATVLRIMSLLAMRYSTEEKGSDSDSALLSAVKRTLGYIHAHVGERLTLDRLAEEAGLSKYYLAREFHRVTGYTVVSYVNHLRCENAKRLLVESKASILSIASDCGFPNASYFSRTFAALTGTLPGEYRKKALSEQARLRPQA